MEKLFCPHCKKEITDVFKDHIDQMGMSKGLEIAKKKENELKATFDEETKKVKKQADKKNELKDIEHNKERVRWKKTTEKMKQEMEQKITVDQGSGQEIILGNHLKEIVFKINSDALSGLNIAQIDPTIREIKSDNNKFSFNGNLGVLENDILFITGSLSPNTQLITRISEEIQNANLYHYYRTNQNQWNEEFLNIVHPKFNHFINH